MPRLRQSIANISTSNRSRVSNGSKLFLQADGRSTSARRLRDLIRNLEGEFEVASEIDRTLIRQAATLALKGEQLAAALARGEDVDADILSKLAGQQCRIFSNLRRRADASPSAPLSILDRIVASHDEAREDEEGD
jgi:hypothetical protein